MANRNIPGTLWGNNDFHIFRMNYSALVTNNTEEALRNANNYSQRVCETSTESVSRFALIRAHQYGLSVYPSQHTWATSPHACAVAEVC